VKESDQRIIQRVRQGEMQAYALLVDRYKDRVFSLALGIVRSREVAEELAQDVFVKAYNALHKFREEASFATWIYRIAYNTAISETRKRKITFVALDDNHSVLLGVNETDNSLKEDEVLRLKNAISALNHDEQTIIQLYYLEEKSVEEVSLCLSLSQANVKVKLFRLRAKLKKMLEKSPTPLIVG